MTSVPESEDDKEEFEKNWFEDLAIIETLTRQKGFKEGYKVGKQQAASQGFSSAAKAAADPYYDYGCLHAFSRAYLERLQSNNSETVPGQELTLFTSLIKEVVHKTEASPENILQTLRDLDGLRFKIKSYETQLPVLKLLRANKPNKNAESAPCGDDLY